MHINPLVEEKEVPRSRAFKMAMKKSTHRNADSTGLQSPMVKNPSSSQKSLRNNFEHSQSKKAILKNTLAEIEASIKSI